MAISYGSVEGSHFFNHVLSNADDLVTHLHTMIGIMSYGRVSNSSV